MRFTSGGGESHPIATAGPLRHPDEGREFTVVGTKLRCARVCTSRSGVITAVIIQPPSPELPDEPQKKPPCHQEGSAADGGRRLLDARENLGGCLASELCFHGLEEDALVGVPSGLLRIRQRLP